MHVRQYILGRVLGRTPRWHLRHARHPSRTPRFAHAHHDADRRCRTFSQRLLGGWAFALAFLRESVRQPRRVLHCSCNFTSIQTVPSERRSARPSFACHGACSSTADEPACETKCEAQCHRRACEWSGRLLCTPSHKRRGSLCTIWQRRRENTCTSTGQAKNHRPVRTTDAEPQHHLLWSWIGSRCFHTAFALDKHIILLDVETLIILLRRVTREGIRAQRLLVLADTRVVLGAVSKGRSTHEN